MVMGWIVEAWIWFVLASCVVILALVVLLEIVLGVCQFVERAWRALKERVLR